MSRHVFFVSCLSMSRHIPWTSSTFCVMHCTYLNNCTCCDILRQSCNFTRLRQWRRNFTCRVFSCHNTECLSMSRHVPCRSKRLRFWILWFLIVFLSYSIGSQRVPSCHIHHFKKYRLHVDVWGGNKSESRKRINFNRRRWQLLHESSHNNVLYYRTKYFHDYVVHVFVFNLSARSGSGEKNEIFTARTSPRKHNDNHLLATMPTNLINFNRLTRKFIICC